MATLQNPTAEQIGIPQELYDIAKNYVLKTKREGRVNWTKRREFQGNQKFSHPTIPNRFVTRSVWDWVNKFTFTETTRGFGVTLVEMIQAYLLDYGYNYVGRTENGGFILTQENPYSAEKSREIIISFSDEKVVFNDVELSDLFTYQWVVTTTDPVTKKLVTNRTTVEFTAAEIAEMTGKTEQEVLAAEDDFWEGDLGKNWLEVKTTLSAIVREGNQVFANLFINEKEWDKHEDKFGSFIWPYGKAGQDFQVQWRLFNGGSGNFGETGYTPNFNKFDIRAQSINVASSESGQSYYDPNTHTMFYSTWHAAWLKFEPELLPDQGKNAQQAVYIELNTGEVRYSMNGM